MEGVAYDIMQKQQEFIKKKEDKLTPPPQSSMITRAIRAANNIVQGVNHSPLDKPGCAREDAQPMEQHCSLKPSITKFNEAYYKLHLSGRTAPLKGKTLHKKAYKVPSASPTIGVSTKELAITVTQTVVQ